MEKTGFGNIIDKEDYRQYSICIFMSLFNLSTQYLQKKQQICYNKKYWLNSEKMSV